MLFDLRARGRRRTVQVVYLGLALLFGMGFIGFGVGGGFGGGGVVEGLFGGKEGSGGSGFQTQVAAAEKRAHKHPNEAAAWSALADAQFHQASASEYYEEAKQQFTSQGKALLVKVASSWSHYMALKPANPDLTVAQEMLRVYGQEGLNQPGENVALLQQIVIPAKPPTAALYGQLAEFAYQASNTSVGDLASQKAVSLAPPAERARVKQALEAVKKNPTGSSSGGASTTAPGG
jgi:hypothetical protein